MDFQCRPTLFDVTAHLHHFEMCTEAGNLYKAMCHIDTLLSLNETTRECSLWRTPLIDETHRRNSQVFRLLTKNNRFEWSSFVFLCPVDKRNFISPASAAGWSQNKKETEKEKERTQKRRRMNLVFHSIFFKKRLLFIFDRFPTFLVSRQCFPPLSNPFFLTVLFLCWFLQFLKSIWFGIKMFATFH